MVGKASNKGENVLLRQSADSLYRVMYVGGDDHGPLVAEAILGKEAAIKTYLQVAEWVLTNRYTPKERAEFVRKLG